MTKLVRFVCQERTHQQPPLFDRAASWAPNTLTFREGAWAYCPMGAPDGHRWVEVPDRPFEEVRDEMEHRISEVR